MPNTCIVCGRVKGKGQTVSMHRFPADPTKKQEWLRVLGLTEDDITDYSRICSRHFLFGDTSIPPSVDIGKRFFSPKKLNQDRGKRALKRLSVFKYPLLVSNNVGIWKQHHRAVLHLFLLPHQAALLQTMNKNHYQHPLANLF